MRRARCCPAPRTQGGRPLGRAARPGTPFGTEALLRAARQAAGARRFGAARRPPPRPCLSSTDRPLFGRPAARYPCGCPLRGPLLPLAHVAPPLPSAARRPRPAGRRGARGHAFETNCRPPLPLARARARPVETQPGRPPELDTPGDTPGMGAGRRFAHGRPARRGRVFFRTLSCLGENKPRARGAARRPVRPPARLYARTVLHAHPPARAPRGRAPHAPAPRNIGVTPHSPECVCARGGGPQFPAAARFCAAARARAAARVAIGSVPALASAWRCAARGGGGGAFESFCCDGGGWCNQDSAAGVTRTLRPGAAAVRCVATCTRQPHCRRAAAARMCAGCRVSWRAAQMPSLPKTPDVPPPPVTA